MKKALKHLSILFLLIVFMTGCARKMTYPLIDTKFKLHEYNSAQIKDLAFIKIGTTTQLYCSKHSEWENIKVKNIHHEWRQRTNYAISDPYPIQDAPQQDTFNSQRNE